MKNSLLNFCRRKSTLLTILTFALTLITSNNSWAQYTTNAVTGAYEVASSWNGTAPNTNGTVNNYLTIISGSNITRNGNIKISGGYITLNGKLSITGNYSETGPWGPILINQSGELVVNGTFTTGVGTTINGKITVDGISTFNGALTINNSATASFKNTLKSGSTNIYGTLNSFGATEFTNTSTIYSGGSVNITGSFKSASLTQNGVLSVTGNTTFSNTVTIGATASTTIGGILSATSLTTNSNVSIGSTATITSLTVNSGSTVEIFGDLNATDVLVNTGGTLIVHGATDAKNGLTVYGTFQSGNVTAKDMSVAQGGLAVVQGDIYTSNGLAVSGDVVATGDINAKGLIVNSTGNLVVAGDVFTARGWTTTPTGNSNVYILNPDASINVAGSSNIATGNYGDVNAFVNNESGNTTLSTIVDNLNMLSLVTWYSYNTGSWTSNSNWTLDATLATYKNTTTAGKTITPGIADNYVVKSGKTITINSSDNVTTAKITIESTAILNLAAGSKLTTNDVVTNNGTFNLEFSTALPCSYINKKATSGNNITIKRTFEGGRAWYIGNCIADVAYSTFTNATPTPTPATGLKLMYSYDTNSKTWQEATSSLSLMKGYSINFGTQSLYTVTQSGTIPTGNQSTTLIATGDKWNLLANPFPAYIDFSLSKISEWNISNIDPSLYVRTRINGVSAYYTVNLTTGISTPAGLTYLAPMQAFFVKATAGGNFTINSAARIHPTSAPTLKAAAAESDVLRLTTTNASSSDETVLVFKSIGNERVSTIDSEKKLETAGVTPQLFSLKDQKNIAINIMPEDPTPYTIPLAMTVGTKGAGEITLNASNIAEFMPNVDVYLKDLTTSTVTDLRQSPSYTFTTAAVSALNRFELFFKKSAEQATSTDVKEAAETVSIKTYAIENKAIIIITDNTFSGNAIIELFDATGKLITNKTSAAKRTEIEMTGSTQMVVVKVTYKSQSKSFKIMKSLGL